MEIDQVVAILSEYGICPDAEKEPEEIIVTGKINEGDLIETVSLKQMLKTFSKQNRSANDNIPEDDLHNHIRDSVSPEDHFFIPSSFWEVKHGTNYSFLDLLRDKEARTFEKQKYLANRKNKIWDKENHNPCAWYSPCHFYGAEMGIYIKQSCLDVLARNILLFSEDDPISPLSASSPEYFANQFFFAAFIYLFLHEQYHHKVESMGFRCLVTSGEDKYRNYMRNVYRPTWWTDECIEESLANAESFRRLTESKYKKSLHPVVWKALRNYLASSMPYGPPGYRKGVNYFSEEAYRTGIYTQQSLLIKGAIPSGGISKLSPAPHHWAIAPYMIKALFDISDEVFVVVPKGYSSIIRPKPSPPGFTTSTKELVSALLKHHGYSLISGGKGSHIKLVHETRKPLIIPGGRKDLRSGTLNNILSRMGNHSINQLPKILNGTI